MVRTRIHVAREQPFEIHLAPGDHQLLAGEALTLDEKDTRRFREKHPGEAVTLTLEEIEDLMGHLAIEAGHTQDGNLRRTLDRVLLGMKSLVDIFTDDGDEDASEPPRGLHMLGSVAFQITREGHEVSETRRPGSTPAHSLKLTEAQRRVIARIEPGLRPRLELEKKNQRTLRFSLAELERLGDAVQRARRNPRNGRERHSLDCVSVALARLTRVYQLRIELEGIEPPIWRRILLHDCTLHELHDLIQLVMPWWDYHLYSFTIGGREYANLGSVDEDFGLPCAGDTRLIRLSDVVPEDGSPPEFQYLYDFGDSWKHVIRFERWDEPDDSSRYPLCPAGSRACPPEDVGGVHGYEQYVEAIADPGHDEHHEFLQWRGPFDSEAFSAEEATARLRDPKSYWDSFR